MAPERDVEAEYRRRNAAMTPAERVAKSAAMFEWSREIIRRRIIAERGEISPDELKWRVALHQYGDELQVRKLIERLLADVSS